MDQSTGKPDQYIEQMEEVTLKDLLLTVKSFSLELLHSWKILVLICIPFLAYFLYTNLTTKPIYNASITFMISEDEKSGAGGVGSLLMQFGLGGGGGDYNLEKITELTKSLRIIKEALLEKGKVNDRMDYYANHLIEIYNLDEKWKDKNPDLVGFRFSSTDVDSYSRKENKALKSVYNEVKGNKELGIEGLLGIEYGDDTRIFKMKMETYNEELSIGFVEIMYEKLSTFYITETIKKSKETYDNLKEKVDSFNQALVSTEYQLAQAMDQSRGLVLREGLLKQARLERQVRVLGLAYGKALENMEVADFALKNATPFFQTIDAPFAPLKPQKDSLIKATLMGLIIGLLLGGLFIIARKIIRDALGDE